MALIYKSVEGLKNAWKAAVGVSMLEERGIRTNTSRDLEAAGSMSGLFLGWVPGLVAGLMLDSGTGILAGLSIWAASIVALPIALHQPYALYKAGEHDEKLRLANAGKQAAALPKPEQREPDLRMS